MQHNTVRGVTATLAVTAALAGGMASASAAPLPLEPYTEPVANTQVAEEFTSFGSSTISASVNAKVACLFQRTFSAMVLDC
ncbi:hypothetical protein IU433_27750 [Nocardia puris]|uniref:Uncharacterized protein n=1 Tax=Nocardia puris TaxID=208602 RepID=A0A366E398_9NOCA|nr:hypothetical protein [Nocardia puris]MBF6214429.1 hypothetical protein [Nocardia puris]MBF6369044.1 hypothetical protein [Nocardia puris]MBF6462808.1 hypothetical protein [Nocardia puris]RBO96813.1 hypothetical protein DFR74_101830 [Nocardia puris]